MRLAVIADVHGNLPALEAVLADARGRGVDRFVDLGDLASGPLWPREAVARLRALGAPTARGNHDRIVGEGGPAPLGPSDAFALAALDPGARAWLRGLPARLDLPGGVVAVHGRPGRDDLYLLDAIEGGRLVPAAPAAVARRLAGLDARVVLCGHSHRAALLRVPGGPLVLNPGSVGLPAYADDHGAPHLSEAGAPHARYAILDLDEGPDEGPDEGLDAGAEPLAAFLAVPYDHEAAARRAEAGGRPDWAGALRTGVMPGAGLPPTGAPA